MSSTHHCSFDFRSSSQTLSLSLLSVKTNRYDVLGRDRNDVTPSSSSVVDAILRAVAVRPSTASSAAEHW